MKILVEMKVCYTFSSEELSHFLLQLREPEHEILTLRASDDAVAATEKIRDLMAKLAKGQYGKKVLLKIEQSAD